MMREDYACITQLCGICRRMKWAGLAYYNFIGMKANISGWAVEDIKLHTFPPLTDHHGSICRNLNVTCCKPTIEKHSQVLANNEYKFYYNQIFESHAETCESPGKQLHSMLHIK